MHLCNKKKNIFNLIIVLTPQKMCAKMGRKILFGIYLKF